jgi:hypothetical protein
MSRKKRISPQEQAKWREFGRQQQSLFTGKVYGSGQMSVIVNNNSSAFLPSQICDEVVVGYPTSQQSWNQPLDSSLTTVTTSGSANTFVQLASALADQIVIFNQSGASVLSVGFSATPGAAVVPIAINSNFTFNLGFGSNVNRLFVASAGTSQVFSYMIRLLPVVYTIVATGAAGPVIGPGNFMTIPVPVGPGFTGNANQIQVVLLNSPVASATFYVTWRRYSI